jgi:hypothetical protein
MMGPAHRSLSSPFGLGLTVLASHLGAGPVQAVIAGGLVIACSKLPDLDHPRFQGTYHPAAAAARASARLMLTLFYVEGVEEERKDLHRGPTHTIEWSVAVGVLAFVAVSLAGSTLGLEPLTELAPWVGAGVGLGACTHLVGDWPTYSGIPGSLIYNRIVHGCYWQRHSLHLIRTDHAAEHLIFLPLGYVITFVGLLGWTGQLGSFVDLINPWYDRAVDPGPLILLFGVVVVMFGHALWTFMRAKTRALRRQARVLRGLVGA